MRVTDVTKREQVVSHIQKNDSRVQSIQQQLATGRKINKTSDDPIGTTVIQDVVTSVSRGDQMKRNIDTNINWLERTAVELDHIAELMERIKVLVLSQSNDSSTGESREIVAQELRALRQALFEAGNARSGKLYLFSGTKTLTKPLEYNDPIQRAKVVAPGAEEAPPPEKAGDVAPADETSEGLEDTAVEELLNVADFKAQFEGNSNNEYRLRISKTGTFGTARYQISDDAGETWGPEQILLPVVKVVNPDSEPDDQVILRFTDEQGLLSDLLEADSSGFLDLDKSDLGVVFPEDLEFVFLPNPKVSYQGNSQKKEVLIGENTTVPLNITAEELFLKTGDGTINVFEVLAALESSLELDSQEAVSARLDELDSSRNQVLAQLAEVGNTTLELEKAKLKLDEQKFSNQVRLSEVQDIDLPTTMVEMNSAEVNKRTSLDAGSRLIQPTLLEFLR